VLNSYSFSTEKARYHWRRDWTCCWLPLRSDLVYLSIDISRQDKSPSLAPGISRDANQFVCRGSGTSADIKTELPYLLGRDGQHSLCFVYNRIHRLAKSRECVPWSRPLFWVYWPTHSRIWFFLLNAGLQQHQFTPLNRIQRLGGHCGALHSTDLEDVLFKKACLSVGLSGMEPGSAR
jgi:hypothetical protein